MKEPIKVWDIAVRVFHWSLVTSFFIAYLSGDDAGLLHIYSGYAIVGLLAFRVVWGIIGTKYARFTNFVTGIKPVLSYLKSILAGKPQHYLGHNPAGGLMIVLLLIFLSLTSWTGLELYALEGKGPLANIQLDIHAISPAHAKSRGRDDDDRYAHDNERGHDWLEELHEAIANFTLLLVFIHIAGVIVSGWLHRENLVKAMWTGYKTPPEE
ncbi:MAG: cytochrome b/b6 domain-containing protein [Gammaproteobacteria bacterium]|nr:cytochrome b/b6 domain-containing protein [Gammaproteobacteria bacterium]